jgi:hypothetical protein
MFFLGSRLHYSFLNLLQLSLCSLVLQKFFSLDIKQNLISSNDKNH